MSYVPHKTIYAAQDTNILECIELIRRSWIGYGPGQLKLFQGFLRVDALHRYFSRLAHREQEAKCVLSGVARNGFMPVAFVRTEIYLGHLEA